MNFYITFIREYTIVETSLCNAWWYQNPGFDTNILSYSWDISDCAYTHTRVASHTHYSTRTVRCKLYNVQ